MSDELDTEGYGEDVDFVIVNASYASSTVTNLTDVCDFPVFQDTADVGAWGLHEGGKDDIFIYADGELSVFLPYGGAVSTSLSGVGYDNVKGAILEAIDAP